MFNSLLSFEINEKLIKKVNKYIYRSCVLYKSFHLVSCLSVVVVVVEINKPQQ